MAIPAFGESHSTIPGHTLQSLGGATDPNAMNEEWRTPLMTAALKADEKTVKDLFASKGGQD
jgi:hypothetical protein